MRNSIILNTSTEEFTTIIKNSKCIADICRFMGLRREGGYYHTINRRIKRENIDTSHFLSVSELMKLKDRNVHWINKDEFIKNWYSNMYGYRWMCYEK